MGISSGQSFGYLVFALANVGRGFVKKSVRPFFRNNILQLCLNRSIGAFQGLAMAGAVSIVWGFSLVEYQVRALRRGPCCWSGHIGPEHFGRQNLQFYPCIFRSKLYHLFRRKLTHLFRCKLVVHFWWLVTLCCGLLLFVRLRTESLPIEHADVGN